jgi:probable phosphoglycerate mutase
MRHGDVSYFDNAGRPFPPEGVPLNVEGRSQAEAARAALAEIALDRVVSSDLVRSIETAELVARGRGLSVEQRTDLREIQPGRLRDIPSDALEEAFVGAFAGGLNRETRFLGGETFGSLVDRVQANFQTLLADTSWRNLLLVAHGGVNRVILAGALGLGIDGFGSWEQDPACINILDIDAAGRWLIRLVNYTAYNPAKVGLSLTTMERLYAQYRKRVMGA